MRLEAGIFGLQPSLAFMERLPYLPVSELFYASYFSYYVMIAGVGLALFCRNREQFFHYVSVVSFVFYVCYLIYIFTPVMGPRIFFREIVGLSTAGGRATRRAACLSGRGPGRAVLPNHGVDLSRVRDAGRGVSQQPRGHRHQHASGSPSATCAGSAGCTWWW